MPSSRTMKSMQMANNTKRAITNHPVQLAEMLLEALEMIMTTLRAMVLREVNHL